MNWSATRLVSPNGRHVLEFFFGNNSAGANARQVADIGLRTSLGQNAPFTVLCSDDWQNPPPALIFYSMLGVSSGAVTAGSVGSVTGNFAGYYTVKAPAQEFAAFVRDVVLPVLASFPKGGVKTERPDRDGDGVADLYDNFPDDASRH